MELEEAAEEALETLWVTTQEQDESGVAVDDLGREPVDALAATGFVKVAGGLVTLTEGGLPEARGVVRRHRLAERLLHDVLGSREDLMHEKACRFEHLLDRGLDENICTLLGHPRVCPHGKPIPLGRCCHEEHTETRLLVSPLSQLEPGHQGKVAYLYAPEAGNLQKLMAMGILPGAPITLVRRFPSVVFDAGNTQFAVDEHIADAIYVRLVEDGADPAGSPDVGTGKRPWWRPRWLIGGG
ncbi:MAG: metal-dependent transcriptional regulator [Dehalococcoidales bacterium]